MEDEDQFRARLSQLFMDAAQRAFDAIPHGVAHVVLALDDAISLLKEQRDSLASSCRDVRTSQPPPPPRSVPPPSAGSDRIARLPKPRRARKTNGRS